MCRKGGRLADIKFVPPHRSEAPGAGRDFLDENSCLYCNNFFIGLIIELAQL